MYDVIILGAGSAGLSAASIFKKSGQKYLIVHHGFKGTTCASRGCMPSKALIQVATSYHERKKFKQFGITGSDKIGINMAKVMQHVRTLLDRFTNGMIKGLDKYEIVYGKPKFLDANTLEVQGKQYQAKAFIIATGSAPRIPELYQPFEDDLLTTDNFFEQKDFPLRIAVVGLGAIGAELGQTLARLDIKVTGINRSQSIAGLSDVEFLEKAKNILSEDMRLILDADVEAIDKTEKGYNLKLKDKTIQCDKILLAVGRVPNLEGLNLKQIGVCFTDRDIPEYDLETLKIKDFPIYMAGDCNKYKAILHEANDESNIIAAQILNQKSPKRRVPLLITFIQPNLAQIGQQADEIEQDFVTGCVSFEDQGRARVMAENQGLLKIYASKHQGTILGACLLAPAGEHLAHLIAMAVQQKLTVKEFLKLPYYHPTIEEGLRTALRKMYDPKRKYITDKLC